MTLCFDCNKRERIPGMSSCKVCIKKPMKKMSDRSFDVRPVQIGCDDCLDARKVLEAEVTRLREALKAAYDAPNEVSMWAIIRSALHCEDKGA